jgi:hypothetical protein
MQRVFHIFFFGFAALLLLSGAGLLLVGRAVQAPASDPALIEARARWAARPFEAYRLVAQFDTCYYDVTVRREQVHGGLRDSCFTQARSIGGLFDVIARDGQVTPNCGVRTCTCEAITSVHAEYHPTLGYPTTIMIMVETRPLWSSLDTWRTLIETRAAPVCNVHNQRAITVLHVEPLAR